MNRRYIVAAYLIWLTLLWVAVCGVWPFANPEHNFHTVLGTIDLTLHWAATFILFILVIETRVMMRRRLERE